MEMTKARLLEIANERGGLNRISQMLRVEYLHGSGDVTPKVIIGVATTEHDNAPRSFRTDNPDRLRDVIKVLIKCLHQLEQDLKH